jgi:hypothetical protein
VKLRPRPPPGRERRSSLAARPRRVWMRRGCAALGARRLGVQLRHEAVELGARADRLQLLEGWREGGGGSTSEAAAGLLPLRPSQRPAGAEARARARACAGRPPPPPLPRPRPPARPGTGPTARRRTSRCGAAGGPLRCASCRAAPRWGRPGSGGARGRRAQTYSWGVNGVGWRRGRAGGCVCACVLGMAPNSSRCGAM